MAHTYACGYLLYFQQNTGQIYFFTWDFHKDFKRVSEEVLGTLYKHLLEKYETKGQLVAIPTLKKMLLKTCDNFI